MSLCEAFQSAKVFRYKTSCRYLSCSYVLVAVQSPNILIRVSLQCPLWRLNEWPILLFISRLIIQSSTNILRLCSPDRDPMTVVAAIPPCCHHAPRPWPRPSKLVRGIQKKSRFWWCKRCQWGALSVAADLRRSSVASRFRTQVGDRWEHCRYCRVDTGSEHSTLLWGKSRFSSSVSAQHGRHSSGDFQWAAYLLPDLISSCTECHGGGWKVTLQYILNKHYSLDSWRIATQFLIYL